MSAETLSTLSIEQMKVLLFELLCEGHSDTVELAPYPDAVVQLQDWSDQANVATRERLKTAVFTALREWRHRAHGYGSLCLLAQVAAATKASAAVPVLVSVTESRPLADTSRREVFEAWAQSIATVAGFAPSEDVERALSTWFDAPETDARLAAQLFIGLCRCVPQQYWRFMPRFLEMRKAAGGHFDDEFVAGLFADVVAPQVFLRNFEKMSEEVRRDCWAWVSRAPECPHVFDVWEGTIRCPQAPGLAARIVGSAGEFDQLAAIVGQELGALRDRDLHEELRKYTVN